VGLGVPHSRGVPALFCDAVVRVVESLDHGRLAAVED